MIKIKCDICGNKRTNGSIYVLPCILNKTWLNDKQEIIKSVPADAIPIKKWICRKCAITIAERIDNDKG